MATGTPLPQNEPCVLILNAFPNGLDFTDTKVHVYGRALFNNTSTYVTDGVPMTIVGPFSELLPGPIGTLLMDGIPPYVNNPFIFGDAYCPSSGNLYWPDPDNQTLRIFSGGTEVASGSSLPTDMVFVHLVSNRTPDQPLNSLIPSIPGPPVR